ncbi:hypothetical protein [Tabrizicola sp.]|uniref:hypothetical protein n=1 Tax=Tabrizicola sp. TaxID=2005166 RepID=UPI003F33D42F
MILYQKQFSDELDQPPVLWPQTTVLIASTPRCGSHMLGHAMAGTGLLGVAISYAVARQTGVRIAGQEAKQDGAVGEEELANVTTPTKRRARSALTEDWINRYTAERRPSGPQGFGFGRLAGLVRS